MGEPKTKRVRTDVWLVEQAMGGCISLMARVDATGQEVVSATDRVRWQWQQDDGARAEPLPVGAITDGAKTMHCQLAGLCGQPVPSMLDGYHLAKKGWEMRSMVTRTKQEQAIPVKHPRDDLWHGRMEAALTYLQTAVHPTNTKKRAAFVTSLAKHQAESIDDGRCQWTGKLMGSGRREKAVDQVIGARQKSKGMRGSPTGSTALSILQVTALNQQWEQLWFPQQTAA